jgi:hypothetical protein
MATLIARISEDNLRQYDETNQKVIYKMGSLSYMVSYLQTGIVYSFVPIFF